MRLSASEKLEIIGLVEQSHLPARRTLQMLGIKPSTFYRWYDRFRSGGLEALEDKPSKPDRVWNRIPDDIRQRVVMMAFEQPELSPRELATRFTDTNRYYVSESSVYRLLKAHDLIGSPAFIIIKAADEFRDKTTAQTTTVRGEARQHLRAELAPTWATHNGRHYNNERLKGRSSLTVSRRPSNAKIPIYIADVLDEVRAPIKQCSIDPR